MEKLENLVKKIFSEYPNNKVFFLIGDLGSGKTTFVKHFAKLLGFDGNVQSPTFILHREYGQNIDHIDLYRLENQSELSELRLNEISKDHYIFIEWADKFMDYLKTIYSDRPYLTVYFSSGSDPEYL